jgi:hypothetical protein
LTRSTPRIAFWITPPLVCLAVYWLGLKAWFQQDDFAWLHLRLEIDGWRDFFRLLIEPRAQGTIRPLSERLFFIVFSALFGLDALPFRIWVFLTQFANLALIGAIGWRLTGSRLAGWLAAVFWISGSGLAKVMSWTSAYNQALCALCLLASFYLLVRHVETGRRSYGIGQWVAYLAGFGAQEWMVVYPALATAWLWVSARGHLRKAAALWPPAVAYALLHHLLAPPPSGGTYGLYFDWGLPLTLATYWRWAVTAAYSTSAVTAALAAILTLALGAFVLVRWRRGDRLPAFFALWFVIAVAPVLPLRRHITEYYLTLPTVGSAMLGGYAVARGLAGRGPWKAAAVLLAAAHLAVALPAARTATRWNYERSRAVRGMVRGVARANQLHPGKVVLLVGVDSDLFWTGVFDEPFRLVGRNSVFLAPGSEAEIEPHPEFGDVGRFVLPPGAALRALEEGRLVIYAVEPDRLRNVTQVYAPLARLRWQAEEPRQVDVAEPVFSRQLGTGWYSIQDRHRWTAKRATLRLGGPRTPSEKLYVEGYCPAERLRDGPVQMLISVEGVALPAVQLHRPNARFQAVLELPAQTVGRESIEVAIEVDRTFRVPKEGRDLGLAFGRFAIR